MALNLRNLDERTRYLMLQELQLDVTNQSLYVSDWLNTVGQSCYPDLLRIAIQKGNDISLAADLRGICFDAACQKTDSKTSDSASKTMPVEAPEMLAEREFNRYYIRALCRRVLEDGNGVLRVYKAKELYNPRPESQKKIGKRVDPVTLLADLRTSISVETALEIPGGPNTGLSIELLTR